MYDGNGNLQSETNSVTTTQNKSFTYNLLNLPQTVTVPTGTITYTYDATGNKLRKVDVISGNTTTTDYINGIQYKIGATAIDFIQTEEGRATVPLNGTVFNYTYDLKDYLGNVRASFDNGGTGGATRVVQEDNYYPFGLDQEFYHFGNQNRYLYNGKELQLDLTSQYDYGARFYDPVIGRSLEAATSDVQKRSDLHLLTFSFKRVRCFKHFYMVYVQRHMQSECLRFSS